MNGYLLPIATLIGRRTVYPDIREENFWGVGLHEGLQWFHLTYTDSDQEGETRDQAPTEQKGCKMYLPISSEDRS